MPAPIILLAEDELIIRRAMQAALEEEGFVVRTATDGDDGCAVLAEMKDNAPQLLITDVDMPGCGGEELAEYARKEHSQIKVLFTSGRPRPSLLKAIAADANTRFLEKPFMPEALLLAIEELGVA